MLTPRSEECWLAWDMLWAQLDALLELVDQMERPPADRDPDRLAELREIVEAFDWFPPRLPGPPPPDTEPG